MTLAETEEEKDKNDEKYSDYFKLTEKKRKFTDAV